MARPLYDIANAHMCSIYVIKNSVNNKVYVGQTWRSIERRFQVHIQNSTANHCVKLRRAILKYGVDKFVIELLTFCHSQKMADYLETLFIRKFDSIKNGYNILEFAFSRKGTKRSLKNKQRFAEEFSGAGNPNSILTLSQVSNIRKEFLEYHHPKTGSKYGAISFLAKKYGVGISTVFEIVKEQAWK